MDATVIGATIAILGAVWFVLKRVSWYWIALFLLACSIVSAMIEVFLPWW